MFNPKVNFITLFLKYIFLGSFVITFMSGCNIKFAIAEQFLEVTSSFINVFF